MDPPLRDRYLRVCLAAGRIAPTSSLPERILFIPGSVPSSMPIDTTGALAIRMTSQHNASMTKSITIRNVPDGTCRELASRAASNGHSLQSYLRTALIDLADRPDVGEVVERIRERKALTGTRLSAASILRYRDADRR